MVAGATDEALEDPCPLFGSDAGAIVGNCEQCVDTVGSCCDRDRRPGRSVSNRVFDQIDYEPVQLIAVAVNYQRLRGLD